MSIQLFISWLLMEALVSLVFYFLNTKVFRTRKENEQPALNLKDTLKGILERIFLIIGLMNGYPNVITAFAALKIGTRINDKENKVSNDYFLIGNLISLLAAIIFLLITDHN